MTGARTDPADDARLVGELISGSNDAIATLYDRYSGAVHAIAFRLTSDRQLAEDIVQETFLTLWNRAEQFDPGIGTLASWLLTIARNRTVDRLRAAGRRPAAIPISSARQGDETDAAAFERIARDGSIVGAAAVDRGPEAALAAAELRLVVGQALAGLPDPERRALLLAYRDGLSQSEIAARTGWPIGTVKTRTRRGLLWLRTTLGPEYAPAAGPGLDPVEPIGVES